MFVNEMQYMLQLHGNPEYICTTTNSFYAKPSNILVHCIHNRPTRPAKKKKNASYQKNVLLNHQLDTNLNEVIIFWHGTLNMLGATTTIRWRHKVKSLAPFVLLLQLNENNIQKLRIEYIRRDTMWIVLCAAMATVSLHTKNLRLYKIMYTENLLNKFLFQFVFFFFSLAFYLLQRNFSHAINNLCQARQKTSLIYAI